MVILLIFESTIDIKTKLLPPNCINYMYPKQDNSSITIRNESNLSTRKTSSYCPFNNRSHKRDIIDNQYPFHKLRRGINQYLFSIIPSQGLHRTKSITMIITIYSLGWWSSGGRLHTHTNIHVTQISSRLLSFSLFFIS